MMSEKVIYFEWIALLFYYAYVIHILENTAFWSIFESKLKTEIEYLWRYIP